ncbi:MAG: DUF1684 domain-containing protein [Bifidobacteriaceae bacterium]|jgi:uncharacterized protein (DUF1684 family)|nr:DUF1684 domain-containing protein [Bifidobacteriaceae bacterium]
MTSINPNAIVDWQAWHASRLAAAPFLASNVGTHWLGRDPLEIPGIPGQWSSADGAACADAIPTGTPVRDRDGAPVPHDGTIRLAPGADRWFGDIRVRLFERDGAFAVRVFDPSAPAAATLEGIDAFDPDPRWAIPGRFIPPAEADRVAIGHVDGLVAETRPTGYLAFAIAGTAYRFTVTSAREDYFAVFADASNGHQTKQFRFLTVRPADGEGNVIVDFNRAYLPPCAFSDHYLCPMPPPGNRIEVPVLAGEAYPRYRV